MSDKATPAFSPRELAVLRLVAHGFSAKQIAIQLKIAPRTVEHHIDHARAKTNAVNRTHMIARVLQTGLLVI
jgi:LuxR family transcriptional regulator, transcriptional regulator of spore coat protein